MISQLRRAFVVVLSNIHFISHRFEIKGCVSIISQENINVEMRILTHKKCCVLLINNTKSVCTLNVCSTYIYCSTCDCDVCVVCMRVCRMLRVTFYMVWKRFLSMLFGPENLLFQMDYMCYKTQCTTCSHPNLHQFEVFPIIELHQFRHLSARWIFECLFNNIEWVGRICACKMLILWNDLKFAINKLMAMV